MWKSNKDFSTQPWSRQNAVRRSIDLWINHFTFGKKWCSATGCFTTNFHCRSLWLRTFAQCLKKSADFKLTTQHPANSYRLMTQTKMSGICFPIQLFWRQWEMILSWESKLVIGAKFTLGSSKAAQVSSNTSILRQELSNWRPKRKCQSLSRCKVIVSRNSLKLVKVSAFCRVCMLVNPAKSLTSLSLTTQWCWWSTHMSSTKFPSPTWGERKN